nr:MAG TPA: hypothetical protein [Caudoviricetes sp.]
MRRGYRNAGADQKGALHLCADRSGNGKSLRNSTLL